MVCGVRRACAPALAILAAALAVPLTASGALAVAPSPPGMAVESAQDTTLEAMGVPTQTLYGRANSVAVYVPAPAAPLAPAGSLLRLVFSHSPLLDPAASAAR